MWFSSQLHCSDMQKMALCKSIFSCKRSLRMNKRVSLCSAIRIYNGENTRFYRVLAAFVEIKRPFRAHLTSFRSSHRVHSYFIWTYFIGMEHFNRFHSSRDLQNSVKILFWRNGLNLRFIVLGNLFLSLVIMLSVI